MTEAMQTIEQLVDEIESMYRDYCASTSSAFLYRGVDKLPRLFAALRRGARIEAAAKNACEELRSMHPEYMRVAVDALRGALSEPQS